MKWVITQFRRKNLILSVSTDQGWFEFEQYVFVTFNSNKKKKKKLSQQMDWNCCESLAQASYASRPLNCDRSKNSYYFAI